MPESWIKYIEQCDSKKIDDTNNIRVLIVKGKKVVIITTSVKPMIKKLLPAWSKMVLV